MPPDSTRRVACPECARKFTARGLSIHRRKRHGASVQAPLPTPVPESMVHEILSALQLLRGAVARIDEHIRVVEAASGQRESPSQEAQRLERELAGLLEEVGRVQRLTASAGADITAGQPADDLARLRREQARVVFRIDELKKGEPNEERFLT